MEGDDKADVSDNMETETDEDARGNDDGAHERVNDRRARALAAEYDASRRAFETCAAFGRLPRGFGRRAVRRRRRAREGRRAGRRGVRAPRAGTARGRGGVRAGAASERARGGEPRRRAGRRWRGWRASTARGRGVAGGARSSLAGAAGRGPGAVAAEMRARYAGPEGFLDALAALRAATNARAETGAGEETREARARARRRAGDQGARAARGAILAHALAAHGDGRAPVAGDDVPVDRAPRGGARRGGPRAGADGVARLEELEAAKARTRGDLDRGDAAGGAAEDGRTCASPRRGTRSRGRTRARERGGCGGTEIGIARDEDGASTEREDGWCIVKTKITLRSLRALATKESPRF